MKVKVLLVASDGGDGSVSAHVYHTWDELFAELNEELAWDENKTLIQDREGNEDLAERRGWGEFWASHDDRPQEYKTVEIDTDLCEKITD